MDQQKLIDVTLSALADQEILGQIFNQVFQYDCVIKEEFKGDYNILPGFIYPVFVGPQQGCALVKVNVTRDDREKIYSFLFMYGPQGLSLNLLYPGTSNVDPHLFQDLMPAAIAKAAMALGNEKIYLKETEILGAVAADGWSECWTWIDETGAIAKLEIVFTSPVVGAGVVYTIKSA